MKNFHFCGQQQTLGSFVLSDVSYRKVWQEEQNKSKKTSFTQQRIEFFSKQNVWNYIRFLQCQSEPDNVDINEKLLIQETYVLEPLKLKRTTAVKACLENSNWQFKKCNEFNNKLHKGYLLGYISKLFMILVVVAVRHSSLNACDSSD